MPEKSSKLVSRLPEFYKKPLAERLEIASSFSGLSSEDKIAISGLSGRGDVLTLSENTIGVFPLPLSIATNFVVNKKPCLVPMATEEASVVAGASFAAKLSLPEGFFAISPERQVAVGQIQIEGFKKGSEKAVSKSSKEILALANSFDKPLCKAGGGAFSLRARRAGRFLVVEILSDVKDAMGANSVNRMCEGVSPFLENLTGGKALARIISNSCPERVCKAQCEWNSEALYESFPEKTLSKREIVRRIISVQEFAEKDPSRAVTHNKGIMNGISALAIATGNDFRAQEAGAHSFAARSGKYLPLTRYKKSKGGIFGEISIPLQMGLVGSPRKNPVARACQKILGAKTSNELCKIGASLGLAQNFAALRALATEGILRGHLELAEKGSVR